MTAAVFKVRSREPVGKKVLDILEEEETEYRRLAALRGQPLPPGSLSNRHQSAVYRNKRRRSCNGEEPMKIKVIIEREDGDTQQELAAATFMVSTQLALEGGRFEFAKPPKVGKNKGRIKGRIRTGESETSA